MKTLQRYWWVVGLLIALGVALFSPLASPHPDGLERIAQDQGFLDRAQEAPYQVMPGYVFPGVANENAATVVAGLAGTVLMFGLGCALAWVLRRRAKPAAQ